MKRDKVTVTTEAADEFKSDRCGIETKYRRWKKTPNAGSNQTVAGLKQGNAGHALSILMSFKSDRCGIETRRGSGG